MSIKTQQLQVLLLSHHSIIRAGLKQVLGQAVVPFIIGETDGVKGAIKRTREENWDIVIVDFSKDGGQKLDLIKHLENIDDGPLTLITSPCVEDTHVKRGLQAGAAGYLQWEEIETHLLRAIDRIMQGEKYIDPRLGGRLLLESGKDLGAPHDCLSDREYQVLCLLVLGKRIVEVAAEMMLSPKTIHTYRKRIQEKMELRTYEEFVQYGRKQQLI